MLNFNEIIIKFQDSKDPKITAAKILLLLAAMGGLVFVGAAAPGLFAIFGDRGFNNKYSKKKIANSLNSLKQRKLIELIEEKDGKHKVIITEKGKKSILRFSLEDLTIPRPKKWDKKWRVLIFDIPAATKRHNTARNALREKIKELGFLKLQKSTWIFPYPCENEIMYVAEMYGVGKFIEILTVEKLLNTEKYLKKFKLY